MHSFLIICVNCTILCKCINMAISYIVFSVLFFLQFFKKIMIFFFFFFTLLAALYSLWDLSFSTSAGPLHWQHEVLTTGPPGTSPVLFYCLLHPCPSPHLIPPLPWSGECNMYTAISCHISSHSFFCVLCNHNQKSQDFCHCLAKSGIILQALEVSCFSYSIPHRVPFKSAGILA